MSDKVLPLPDNTSAYWRRLLGFDRPPDPRILKQLSHPVAVLRFLVFAAASFFIDRFCIYQVEGLSNLNLKPPFILASNHLSNLDYLFLTRRLPKNLLADLCVVAKRWLYRHWGARFFVRAAANCIFVDEKEDFMAALRMASDVLRLNKAIYIAPEGLRSFDGEVGEFKVGVGVLVVENRVPVIPVKIEGTFGVLPRGNFFPRLGQRVTIKLGQPFYAHEILADAREENAYYMYKKVADALRQRIIAL